MPDFFGRVAAAAQWDSFRLSETLYARGAFLPWHEHDESYVTFVLAGGYRERSRAQTRACGARTLVLHPAGDAHEDDFASQPTRCLNVVLDRSFVRRLGVAADALHRGEVVEGAEITSIATRLACEVRREDQAAALIIEGLLLELFGVISRTESTTGWLDEADAIVRARFAEKIGLGDVANAVGVHPVHLARSYRRRFGTSVGERVRALRLDSAREQLAAGAAVAAAAAIAGFADPSHFTKAFRRAHGVGPAEYRRRMFRAHRNASR
ncbi:MAG TPA: AraC family transcriptional regulator [Thermoanaerobaculia bacterium]|nr:AraC family transcriptional regulator [Thermoanaerobaculia bacterium]